MQIAEVPVRGEWGGAAGSGRSVPDPGAAACAQIVEAPALEDATRQLAAELLVTLCEAREKAPGMMRKLPQFIGRLFQSLLSFLLDIEARTPPQAALADRAELFQSLLSFLLDIEARAAPQPASA